MLEVLRVPIQADGAAGVNVKNGSLTDTRAMASRPPDPRPSLRAEQRVRNKRHGRESDRAVITATVRLEVAPLYQCI
jgi:hypothetical protein